MSSSNLYRTASQIANNAESRILTITEVSTANNYISAKDMYGSTYRLSVDFHDPLLTIPQAGEVWQAERQGYEWRLVRQKAETTASWQLKRFAEMKPGDKRLEANGDLHLASPQVVNIQGEVEVRISSPQTTLGDVTADTITADRVLVDGKSINEPAPKQALKVALQSLDLEDPKTTTEILDILSQMREALITYLEVT
jgi:hypothetical protein